MPYRNIWNCQVGIGKYSSLACSDTVHITSYYEGKAYYYIMCKSGNTITTNLVYTLDTDEKNGVEVSIKSVGNAYNYITSLYHIIFFPNVYVDSNVYTDFNDIKIKHYNKYAGCSVSVSHKFLLGNVLYPCDTTQLSSEASLFINGIRRTGIVIKFDIGELSITPNRENIIYTEETKKIINTRILEARDELYSNINKVLKSNHTDIFEYNRNLKKYCYYNVVINDCVFEYDKSYFSFYIKDIAKNVTYKNQDFSKYKEFISNLCEYKIPTARNVITSDKIYNAEKIPYSYLNYLNCNHRDLLLIPQTSRLINSIKLFLRDNYSGYTLFTKFPLSDFITKCKKDLTYFITDECDSNIDYLITEVYNQLMNNAKSLDFSTDADYIKFKEELSNNKIPSAKVQDVILYIYGSPKHCNYLEKKDKYFKNLEEAIAYIKTIKTGVIFNYITPEDYRFGGIAKARGYKYITANKQVMSELKKLDSSNIISLDYLLRKDKTTILLHNYLCNSNFCILSSDILETIPEPIRGEITKLQSLYMDYMDEYTYINHVRELKDIPEDSYVNFICNKIKFYNDAYEEAKSIVEDDYIRSNKLLVTAVISKQKTYRMSNDSYKKINKNKLLRILCNR